MEDIAELSSIERLLRLQECDIRIREMEKELKDIPERKRIENERLTQHRAEVTAAETEAKSRQSAIKQLEIDVQGRKEHILKLRRQQLELKTNKEFAALESEIRTIEGAIRDLEDRELDLMGQAEDAARQLEIHKRALAEEAALVQRDQTAWDQRAAELERQRAQARQTRETLAQAVTQRDWLSLYERVFSRKDRAVVPLEGGVCGGCHMQLPPYVLHDAKKRTALVTCGYCGRLLYNE